MKMRSFEEKESVVLFAGDAVKRWKFASCLGKFWRRRETVESFQKCKDRERQQKFCCAIVTAQRPNYLMNTLNRLFHRRSSLVLGGAALGAGLLFAGAAFGEQNKVSVKMDEQALPRSEHVDTASFSPVVKRVAPSVVKVLVTERAKNVPAPDLPGFFDDPTFRQFFGDPFEGRGQRRGSFRQPQQEGLGSGVIVSTDGYVLTNNHVVNGADVIKITLADGRELAAKVVGTDPKSDLAVIKVEAKDLPAITFTDSDKVEVGDRVLAIGNPFGIGQTVTSGMVSGLGRATLGLDYEDFIQTDAAINPGNSGGALVDVQGRLVGINTAILSRSGGFQGIGFAIPSNLARSVMEQLVSNGKVVRGYLGVSMQELTPELVDSFKLATRTGALVSDVVPGSPAAKAGVKSGDVLTKFNGKSINDARHLKLTVANVQPGTEVAVEVLREGKPVDLKIKVGENNDKTSKNKIGDKSSPGGGGDEGTLNGVGVGDLDPRMRREFDIPAKVQGAIVTEVDPGSAAASAGLQPGDVIQEINHHPVRSADEAVKLTEKTESKKTLLKVWNQQGVRYLVVDESGD
jgi:serine protease Do